MMRPALIRAARRRAALVREGDESGFMLIYVLMIITIVTVLVGTTLVVTASSVVPSVQTAYNQAADAAAQGGVQAFIAQIDQNCPGPQSSMATCVLSKTDSGVVTIVTSASYTASYHWTATQGTNYYRVSSVGVVTQGGVSATKKVIADVTGGVTTNFEDAAYVSQFETQAPDVVQQLFPARTIAVNSTAFANAKIPASTGSGCPSSTPCVSWTGAAAGSTAGTVNTCNALYWGTGGRASNSLPGAPTPYVDWLENGSVGATSYTDYQPCQVSFGHSTQVLAPASSSGGTGLIRSRDALLLSNSYPGGTGPLLAEPVVTSYQYNAATDAACGTAGRNYRSFNLACAGYPVDVGGTPAPGSYSPTYNSSLPDWPNNAPVVQTSACWYQGPTRVLLNADGSATITSPQTTSAIQLSSLACYGGSTPGSSGLLGVKVANIASVSNGVIYVQNNGSAPATTPTLHTNTGWPEVNSRAAIGSANAVFYAAGATPTAAAGTTDAEANDSGCTASSSYVVPTASGPAGACNWSSVSNPPDSNGWTNTASGMCNSSPAVTARLSFECAYSQQTNNAAPTLNYATLRGCVKADLASTTQTATSCLASQHVCNAGAAPANASATDLSCLLNWELSKANTSGHAPAYSSPATGDVQYVVTSTATNAGVTGGTNTAGPTSPVAGDALFSTSGGSTSSTTQTYATTTYTVGRQVYGCYGVLGLVSCLLGGTPTWGDGTTAGKSIAQFKVSITQSTWSTPTGGAPITAQFPQTGDVTPYGMGPNGSAGSTGPGDLYVEGTATATLGLVAQNDVVITNSLAPSSTSAAIRVVARNNVRIYHPVGCTFTNAIALGATTSGFCPNDLTGLYTGVLPNGARPDQQYTNLAGAVSNLSVNAEVFALGNAPTTQTCPNATGYSGVYFCGGEITADNYNRGAGLGTLSITGGMYMAHHGPVGQEWEIPDSTGQSSRPNSGYQLTLRYQNLQTAIATMYGTTSTVKNLLTTTTVNSSTWRIISISTGTGS